MPLGKCVNIKTLRSTLRLSPGGLGETCQGAWPFGGDLQPEANLDSYAMMAKWAYWQPAPPYLWILRMQSLALSGILSPI